MQNLGTPVVWGGGMPESNMIRAAAEEGSERGQREEESQAGPACTEGGATGLLASMWVGDTGPDFKS